MRFKISKIFWQSSMKTSIFTKINTPSRSFVIRTAYLLLECVVMTELQQITIRHILHIESSWKDKQFSLHSPSVSRMKRLKMSRSFYIRRWEQCRRLMRGREGHQEAGEMEVGDRKMRVGRRGGMKSSEMRWGRESSIKSGKQRDKSEW